MRDRFLLETARAVSLVSDYPRAHIGCVIANKGRVVSSGCNSVKTHTLQKRYNKYRNNDALQHSMHAETSAIIGFMNLAHRTDIDPKDCTVYIYREWKNGRLAMARPCPSCMQLLKDTGFKKIVYTTYDGVAKETITQ